MEIHQTFFTDNTLFLLVWNLAPRPADGQDMAALTAQMAEELAAWATLIQTCAPGSKVLLVGSHADEVEGGEAEVARAPRRDVSRRAARTRRQRAVAAAPAVTEAPGALPGVTAGHGQ